jgi:hypothetical protein
MNGSLAQLIALVTHGNASLSRLDVPEVEDTSTFRYVQSVQFVLSPRSRFRRAVVATSATAWFAQLVERGIRTMHLDCTGMLGSRTDKELLEHISKVAFVGSQSPLIIAPTPKEAEVWQSSWDTRGGEPPPDHRIWQVLYQGEARQLMPLGHPPVDGARSQLAGALLEAARYAQGSPSSTHWVQVLEEAGELLTSAEPEVPFYPDLVPPGVDLHIRQVVAAAVKGYVFGAMGSWNDGGGSSDPSLQAEYERVTVQLYRAVMTALDAGVNRTITTA